MLSSKHLHNSKYHSLGLSLKHTCHKGDQYCSSPSLELTQSVTLVFAPALSKENESKATMSWSVRNLFGIGLLSTCPLADSSKIILEGGAALESLKAEPSQLARVSGSNVEFNLDEVVRGDNNNVQVNYRRGEPQTRLEMQEVLATRYLAGYGQEKGEVVTKIENRSDREVGIVYLETLPWYLRVYFHTLSVRVEDSGEELEPLRSLFSLGTDREHPYSAELVLRLPAKSTVRISLNFERNILKWLEYPPDANHGFYVAPAVLTYPCVNESDADCSVRRVYTETLLLNLPTPDFSMPYNVICLACTVVALAFGPLHNITTKSLVVEEGPEKPSLLARVVGKAKRLLRRNKEAAEGENNDQAREEASNDSDERKDDPDQAEQ